ncbi:MAG: hypothetical protein AMXMBFR84_06740 [Candidatus Hydrogenedentota bacterium]
MNREREKKKRTANRLLLAIIFWMPVWVIPFSVFLTEAWIQLQIYGNDYYTSRLRTALRQVNERIENYEKQEAELKTMERIAANGPDLGLVPPRPNQVELVYAAEPEGIGSSKTITFASLEGQTPEVTGAAGLEP